MSISAAEGAQTSQGTLGRVLKRAGSVASLAAIVLGLWIKWDQGRIEERQKVLDDRIKTEHLTVEFTDKIFAHINELGIADQKQREAVIIDLLDMVTSARTSDTGKAAEMLERERSLPLRLALVAGNDESLADMGGTAARYRIWIEYARQSANASVRATALRAIDHVCSANGATIGGAAPGTAAAAAGRDPLLGYLQDVLSLSDDLRADSAPIKQAALSVLQTIVRVMGRDPLKYRGAKSLEEVRALLTNLVGSSATGPARGDPTYVATATATLASLTDSGLLRQTVAEASGAPPRPSAAAPPPDTKATTPVDGLVDALEKSSDDTRATAAMNLYRSNQRISLTGRTRPQVLVAALGDPDPATRKYVSEFLMRAHDRQTVAALWAPMAPLLKDPQPGNQLYNVAVVCGTWARVLPADLDDLRDRMRDVLKQLRKRIDKNPSFAHTATLLAEMGARD